MDYATQKRLLIQNKDDEWFIGTMGLPATCIMSIERMVELHQSEVYPCNSCKHDRAICGGRLHRIEE